MTTGAPPARARAHRLLAEYLRFKYAEGPLELRTHLRRLPREEARLTSLGLAVVAVAVLATPILATLAPRVGGIAFEHVRDGAAAIPWPALALGLAGFSLAWGFLLAGGAQAPGLLWIAAAGVYVFELIPIGLTISRGPGQQESLLHLIVLALPVVLGALTPGGSRWGKTTVAALLTMVALRSASMPPAVNALWRILWLPTALAVVGLAALLSRRPLRSASHRVGVATGVTGLYLTVIALRAPLGDLTGWFGVSLDVSTEILQLLWFLLGAAFVAGAVGLAQFSQRLIEIAIPNTLPNVVTAVVGVLLLLAWVLRFPTASAISPLRAWEAQISPLRTLATGILLVLILIMAIRWRRRGMAQGWLIGWFVLSVAALALLRGYATLDITGILKREAGVLSLAALAYAVTWETVGRLPKVPLQAPAFPQPSLLLLYLGVVLLVTAASLFGLAANLPFFQQVVVLYQYRGAASLAVPMVLLSAAGALPAFSPSGRARLVQAFVLGAIVAVPVFLWQAVRPSLAAGTAPLAVVPAVTALLVVRWRESWTWQRAVAIAASVTLGFAISLHQRVLAALLHPLLTLIAALGGPRTLRPVGKTILEWAESPLSPAPVDWRIVGAAAGLACLVVLAVGRRRAGEGERRSRPKA